VENWRAKQAAVSGRPSWFPGSKLPEHLDGSLPGDFGFDPLGLVRAPGRGGARRAARALRRMHAPRP
jgi:hypothetical protein